VGDARGPALSKSLESRGWVLLADGVSSDLGPVVRQPIARFTDAIIAPTADGYLANTRAEMSFHTDTNHMDRPADYVALRCMQPAAEGGQTRLVDARDILERLSRSALDRLRLPVWRWQRATRDQGGLTPPRPVLTELDCFRWWSYGLVVPSAAEEMVRLEVEQAIVDCATFEHQWNVGDVLVWKNQRILHARRHFKGDRRMSRTHVWV